jgi:hypothetical protein
MMMSNFLANNFINKNVTNNFQMQNIASSYLNQNPYSSNASVTPKSDDEDEVAGVQDLEPYINALKNIGEPELAVLCLDAFAKTALSFFQYENLSKCYFKLKEYIKSMNWGEKAIATSPAAEFTSVMRTNLVNIYNHANYPEKAIDYITINEKTNNSPSLQMDKAYTLYLLDRKREAKVILENILKNHPELEEKTKVKINFNLGTYYLYEDEFQRGLKHFMLEGGKMKLWQVESIFARNAKLNFDFWEGDPKTKNLVVYGEAGIGDEIINVRFLKILKERGMNVVWYTATQTGVKNDRPGLTDMFIKNNIPVITDLKEIDDLSKWCWTYSMRLPIYMDLEYKDLWYGPYLQACPKFKKKWALKVKNLKVGIRWRGSKHYEHDLHRSYPLNQLMDAIGGMNATYYSLQKDDGLEELKDYPNIIDNNKKLETLEDTMALISNLDFVITSCTSVAHMAASQGKKVFILVPISAYYLWCHNQEKTPWYGDNVTVLRQKKPRTWDEPIAELKQILIKEGFIK